MKKIIRLTESDLHRIINESIKEILKEEDSPLKVMIDGEIIPFKNAREYKKYMERRKARQEREAALARGEEPPQPKKTRKKPQEKIADNQASPKALAVNVKNLIYDKALNSIKVFISHGERSYGKPTMDRLAALYEKVAGENLFIKYNSTYREIEATVSDIISWGRKNEHAVYDRAFKLGNLLRDLGDILGRLCNATYDLKRGGAFNTFSGSAIITGRGNGRELGLKDLIFMGRAENLYKTQKALNDSADMLTNISKNGRDAFEYDPNNLRKRG